MRQENLLVLGHAISAESRWTPGSACGLFHSVHLTLFAVNSVMTVSKKGVHGNQCEEKRINLLVLGHAVSAKDFDQVDARRDWLAIHFSLFNRHCFP
jgi:hypothetical protein